MDAETKRYSKHTYILYNREWSVVNDSWNWVVCLKNVVLFSVSQINVLKRSGYVMHHQFNPLTPNDPYRGRNAPLTFKRCILYIYSTNIGTEYFKSGVYSPFLSLENAVCFIILTYFVPVLFTFYIQCVLKLKKNNSGAKRLTFNNCMLCPHCIYVFCIYLRTNCDLCHLQHKLIGFYNRDEKCLQRGTDWVFK